MPSALSDPLLLLTLGAIVIAAIAGGAVFVGMAFYGPREPTPDPLERIVADLFRTPVTMTETQISVEGGSSAGRMRALVASVTVSEAMRARRSPYPAGLHRAESR